MQRATFGLKLQTCSTFDTAGADPDDVVAGGVVGRRHVVYHRVDDALLAADVEPTLDGRVALLKTLDYCDGWVLLVLDAH